MVRRGLFGGSSMVRHLRIQKHISYHISHPYFLKKEKDLSGIDQPIHPQTTDGLDPFAVRKLATTIRSELPETSLHRPGNNNLLYRSVRAIHREGCSQNRAILVYGKRCQGIKLAEVSLARTRNKSGRLSYDTWKNSCPMQFSSPNNWKRSSWMFELNFDSCFQLRNS